MGECGCGATDIAVQLPGPGDVKYGIEIYPGCRYCATPAGIVVHRFDPSASNGADVGEDLFLHAPEAEFHGYGNPDFEWALSEFAMPVLSSEGLMDALSALGDGVDDVGYAEVMFDRTVLVSVVPSAVWASRRRPPA